MSTHQMYELLVYMDNTHCMCLLGNPISTHDICVYCLYNCTLCVCIVCAFVDWSQYIYTPNKCIVSVFTRCVFYFCIYTPKVWIVFIFTHQMHELSSYLHTLCMNCICIYTPNVWIVFIFTHSIYVDERFLKFWYNASSSYIKKDEVSSFVLPVRIITIRSFEKIYFSTKKK